MASLDQCDEASICIPLKYRHHDRLSMQYLVPIPKLDQHVIRAGEKVWLCWVHCYAANVVCVRLKGLNPVHGVVVVHPDKHVV